MCSPLKIRNYFTIFFIYYKRTKLPIATILAFWSTSIYLVAYEAFESQTEICLTDNHGYFTQLFSFEKPFVRQWIPIKSINKKILKREKERKKLLSGNKRKQLRRGFHFALYNLYTLNSYTLKKTLLLRDWIRE